MRAARVARGVAAAPARRAAVRLLPAAAPSAAASSAPAGRGGGQEAYGAPYTNSVFFGPGDVPGSFTLRLALPGSPPGGVAVAAAGGDPVAALLAAARGATGAGAAALLVDGSVRINEADARALTTSVGDLLGRTADLDLDGVRWSVNGGGRLARDGAMPARRSVAARWAAVGVGGAAVLVASLAFWNAVVPQEHRRTYVPTPPRPS